MISIDPLLKKRFDADHYHCVHFVVDAGIHLFDYDFSHCFIGLQGSLNGPLNLSKTNFEQGKEIERPSQGSIVLMKTLDNKHHVGLYYESRVLHLSETGPLFETLRSINRLYKDLRFYHVKDF